tara:strand:+ start:100 stop:294 length:195 start_codon:yes stop_codon:yes gene_type:complete
MKVFFFLNLGLSEVLFILIMYLMFFGSKNIPSLARNIGSSVRKIRDASNDVRKEIKDSILNSKD